MDLTPESRRLPLLHDSAAQQTHTMGNRGASMASPTNDKVQHLLPDNKNEAMGTSSSISIALDIAVDVS